MPYREQDIFLPIANVARIMKNSIPPNGKIAKEAKECVQECVSEFISFITSEAAERCQQEKRKTINGEDIPVQHKSRPIFGVQFHPEVDLTLNGVKMLSNFVDCCQCERD